MLKTPFGNIAVRCNGVSCSYETVPLNKTGELFFVEERYKIEIPTQNFSKDCIECSVNLNPSNEIKVGANSGQNLAAITFIDKYYILTIGTYENDYPDTVTYLDNGLCKQIKNAESVVFLLAWKKAPKESSLDNDTWYAVDQ